VKEDEIGVTVPVISLLSPPFPIIIGVPISTSTVSESLLLLLTAAAIAEGLGGVYIE